MTNPHILFTADLHIKQRTWTNSTLLKGDAYCSFGRVVDAVSNRQELDSIVIGGDLFDSNRPTSQDLLTVKDLLTSNFNACYYIRGNHDSVDPSYLEAITGSLEDDDFHLCRIDHNFYPMDEHVYMTGIEWVPSAADTWERLRQVVKDWRQLRTTPNDILYVVMHTSFQHLLGFDGAYDLTVDMIKGLCGDDRINFLVGHIHTRDTLVYNSAGAYIHSPGSLYPLSSDKMGDPCYASYIELSTGKIEDIPADVRKYVSVNITETDDLLKWLDANGKAPAQGDLPTFVRVVVPESYDQQIILPVSDQYIFKIDRLVAPRDAATTVRSSYSISQAIRDELADQANREMAIDMAEEILASDDPVATIDKWLEFWGVKKV